MILKAVFLISIAVASPIVSAERMKRANLLSLKPEKYRDETPYARDFARLAAALEKRLQSSGAKGEDIKGISREVRALLDDWPKESKSCGLSKLLGRSAADNGPPKKAIELFSQLADLRNNCLPDEYELIARNFNLTLGKKDYLDGDNKLEISLMKVMDEHSNSCRAVHRRGFRDSLASIRRDYIDRLDRILDAQFVKQIFGYDQLRSIVVQGRASILRKLAHESRSLFAELIKLAKEQRNKSFRVNHRGFAHIIHPADFKREVFSYNLVEPCSLYVNRLSLFKRAQFDLALEDSNIDEIVQGDEEMAKAWIRYSLCDAIVGETTKLWDAIKKIGYRP